MKYKLIIADDHKMFLDGLLSILESKEEYEVLFTSKDGENIIKYLENNPDSNVNLVITDISMPKMDGITLNKKIKEKHPHIKTLVVSMLCDANKIEELIKYDIDGYVPKNAEKSELLKAINTIVLGKKYFSKEITDFYTQNAFNKKKEQQIKLSKREVDVIKLIAQEYTTQEIADKLFLSKHTIESYRKNLISKLNVRNLAGITKYALKMGYIEA